MVEIIKYFLKYAVAVIDFVTRILINNLYNSQHARYDLQSMLNPGQLIHFHGVAATRPWLISECSHITPLSLWY